MITPIWSKHNDFFAYYPDKAAIKLETFYLILGCININWLRKTFQLLIKSPILPWSGWVTQAQTHWPLTETNLYKIWTRNPDSKTLIGVSKDIQSLTKIDNTHRLIAVMWNRSNLFTSGLFGANNFTVKRKFQNYVFRKTLSGWYNAT